MKNADRVIDKSWDNRVCHGNGRIFFQVKMIIELVVDVIVQGSLQNFVDPYEECDQVAEEIYNGDEDLWFLQWTGFADDDREDAINLGALQESNEYCSEWKRIHTSEWNSFWDELTVILERVSWSRCRGRPTLQMKSW